MPCCQFKFKLSTVQCTRKTINTSFIIFRDPKANQYSYAGIILPDNKMWCVTKHNFILEYAPSEHRISQSKKGHKTKDQSSSFFLGRSSCSKNLTTRSIKELLWSFWSRCTIFISRWILPSYHGIADVYLVHVDLKDEVQSSFLTSMTTWQTPSADEEYVEYVANGPCGANLKLKSLKTRSCLLNRARWYYSFVVQNP